MKNHFYYFLTFMIVALASISNVNAQQTNAKIQEVYGDKAQELVMNDVEKLAFFTDIVEKRTRVIEMAVNEKEAYPKLSSVPLLNKYNPNLSRDVVFDPLNFNPLKYSFSLSSTKAEYYRVDDTNYLIVIQPQTFKKD